MSYRCNLLHMGGVPIFCAELGMGFIGNTPIVFSNLHG
jgi:hypothetical protein